MGDRSQRNRVRSDRHRPTGGRSTWALAHGRHPGTGAECHGNRRQEHERRHDERTDYASSIHMQEEVSQSAEVVSRKRRFYTPGKLLLETQATSATA